MIKEITNFDRKDLFEYYNSAENPFLFVNVNINVTNVVDFAKKNKISFYATMGFLVTKAINQIENFKYRFDGEKFYYCDKLKSNYTQMINENKIGFFNIPDIDDFFEYISVFKQRQDDLINNRPLPSTDIDELWMSCFPWFKLNSVITPFRKSISIPQVIWDKYEKNGENYTINIMIMAHHGFVDGFHIAQLIEKLNQNIKSFNF